MSFCVPIQRLEIIYYLLVHPIIPSQVVVCVCSETRLWNGQTYTTLRTGQLRLLYIKRSSIVWWSNVINDLRTMITGKSAAHLLKYMAWGRHAKG
jgi:hypothetical protein